VCGGGGEGLKGRWGCGSGKCSKGGEIFLYNSVLDIRLTP
jgi:hypothetical protein